VINSEVRLKRTIEFECSVWLEGDTITFYLDGDESKVDTSHSQKISLLDLFDDAMDDFYYAPKEDMVKLKELQNKLSKYIEMIELMPKDGY
jgi:hypothetical protein